MLDQLKKILPVPKNPVENSGDLLTANQAELGITFPIDFIQFAQSYGRGVIEASNFDFEILSPFGRDYVKKTRQFSSIWTEYRDAVESYDVPLGLFPEPGGLLPFGMRNASWLAWKTVGDADAWPVVFLASYEEGFYQVFEMRMTEFIFELLKGEMELMLHPWDKSQPISFDPDPSH